MGWYEDRFLPNASRYECACLACGRAFWLPKSEVGVRTTCGAACRLELGKRAREARITECAHCKVRFTPRKTQIAAGQGRFCSSRCATVHIGQLWSSEARKTANAKIKEAIAAGRLVPKKGVDHPQWTGGSMETYRRRKESGKNAEQLKRYRAQNPDWARERAAVRRAAKRAGESVVRLPRNTIPKIGELQRWKCAVCKVDIRKKYHVDHVVPLAKGGEHSPSNLQLLCPSCNCRKSAKDPIAFMQERGFLL